MRALTAAALALVIVASAASVADGQAPAARAGQPSAAVGGDVGTPAGELAPIRVRHYRMAGRVRPLLFWFGRDDVGLARVT